MEYVGPGQQELVPMAALLDETHSCIYIASQTGNSTQDNKTATISQHDLVTGEPLNSIIIPIEGPTIVYSLYAGDKLLIAGTNEPDYLGVWCELEFDLSAITCHQPYPLIDK